MNTGLNRNVINLDLFTDAYRVTGQARVGAGGIQSELGSTHSDYMDLTDVYISRIHEPGEIVAGYSQCAFRKENINFIVLQDRRDGLAVGTQHGRSIFTRGRPVNVFLAVPSFEIQGHFMYEGKPTASAILVQSLGRFQPVFEAQASAAMYPEINYAGDVILVQKDRIAICGLDTSKH